MSEVIYLSDVRLSFPNLAEPQKRKNEQTGEERISYNCELIMPEQHAGYQAFMQRFAALAAEKGKEHAAALMQMIHTTRNARCYGNGAEKINKRTFQPYDGYAGMVFITVGNKVRPQVIGTDGKPIDSDNTMAYQALTRKMYGGCRVNAAIKPWWQNPNPQKQINHGIRCDLIAIQFLRDDAPFGDAPPDASGLFGAVQGAPAAAAAPAMPWAQPQAPQMPAPPFAQPQGMPGLPPFMAR